MLKTEVLLRFRIKIFFESLIKTVESDHRQIARLKILFWGSYSMKARDLLFLNLFLFTIKGSFIFLNFGKNFIFPAQLFQKLLNSDRYSSFII